ncbi:hypothetical protein P167DRAFT_580501 [Morchella conica CCBAS932]|uniref:Uncharacterized protein n=1 Tax=Morchella conica CCBAS932 TaxID=1392247 RepID=A0A3N4KAS8_9PEZI|nr:hypothetical protein P167DRAFT_580501 [Morchella conica CCBAS932]
MAPQINEHQIIEQLPAEIENENEPGLNRYYSPDPSRHYSPNPFNNSVNRWDPAGNEHPRISTIDQVSSQRREILVQNASGAVAGHQLEQPPASTVNFQQFPPSLPASAAENQRREIPVQNASGPVAGHQLEQAPASTVDIQQFPPRLPASAAENERREIPVQNGPVAGQQVPINTDQQMHINGDEQVPDNGEGQVTEAGRVTVDEAVGRVMFDEGERVTKRMRTE